MARDLDAGAAWVIAEGRESGTIGLYHADQGIREDLVTAILDRIPPDKVIFEAPGQEPAGLVRPPARRRTSTSATSRRPACWRWKRCGSGCARTPSRPCAAPDQVPDVIAEPAAQHDHPARTAACRCRKSTCRSPRPAIEDLLRRREIYRRTAYLVLRNGSRHRAGRRPARATRRRCSPRWPSCACCPGPDATVWIDDPATDVGNATSLAAAALAHRRGRRARLRGPGPVRARQLHLAARAARRSASPRSSRRTRRSCWPWPSR